MHVVGGNFQQSFIWSCLDLYFMIMHFSKCTQLGNNDFMSEIKDHQRNFTSFP